MTTNVAYWGGSLGVRIPKQEAERVGFKSGTAVSIYVEDYKLIIEKSSPGYTLDDLVSKITQQNLHSVIDADAPVGNETW